MARRTLEQKLSPMALRFATQIARVVQQDTRRAIAAEVKARLRSLKVGAGTSGSTTRSTRKIVVECPAPGCKNQGVRTLMNFCVEHNKSLSAAEKKKMRDAQKQARSKSR